MLSSELAGQPQGATITLVMSCTVPLNAPSTFRGLRGWEVCLEKKKNTVGILNRISYTCSGDATCCSSLLCGGRSLGLSLCDVVQMSFLHTSTSGVQSRSKKTRLSVCREEFAAQNNTPVLQMDRLSYLNVSFRKYSGSQNKVSVAEPNIESPKWPE